MDTDRSPAGREGVASAQPAQIGPYRILETLGEGGMGTVYLAEQSQPVQRRVALKLIKLGMDSKAVVARFEQERQALALMQHDGIAKVHDCGTSDRGQPFFVMELVKGVPLTEFCDQRRLSLPARIGLMQQVCAAVTHAHQKGVVHRDLKPGNVLVSEDQGKVQVKIIDFGLAKAMGKKLVEATLFTEAGQVIGTPEYMAPEQADVTNADIDTRADVYSLGVMLYEVLTGQLPFSGPELRQAGLLEMQRVLREDEPPKPSTRLSAQRDTATTIAAQRRTSAAALHRALKNDLDWVVLKSLEKDRARRYDTANALSVDLQRYLDHEPLVAGPPSAVYRLKKLLRRYRGQVLAGGFVLLALVAGGIGTFVQYQRAEAKANEALEQKGKAEANATLANDKTAEAVREKGRADAKVDEFNQLAGVVLYDRAIANERELYPAWPHRIAAMEKWLQDAGKLLAMKDGIERTVRDLEARALPPTPGELEADRRGHPKASELESLANRVASLRYAQAIRDGKAALVVPELTAAQQALSGVELNILALERVATPSSGGRAVHGEEAFALACAQLAVTKAAGTDDEFFFLHTLALALVANGKDSQAKATKAESRKKTPSSALDLMRRFDRDFDTEVDKGAELLVATEVELADLTTMVTQRRTFRFALEAQQFLHGALAELPAKLDALAANQNADVERRMAWAKQVRDLSLNHPNRRHTWGAVRAAIAAADGQTASELYAGQGIELRDQDVIGLVPIGMNPVTKLWEFYELRSAWDGKIDPRTISIPEHEQDGSIKMTGDTGIVFVLLPGGKFTMGAQRVDPGKPNYDRQAMIHETPRHATLAPFFLARHEMTQGQWARLWHGDRSLRWPSTFRVGSDYELTVWNGVPNNPIGPAHPVENVDWEMCDLMLHRNGLVLPTEAQWEFGCRAGQSTPWYTGDTATTLAGHANVRDRRAFSERQDLRTAEAFDDGFAGLAPVGQYGRSNSFGLYDVHGNVAEWCSDVGSNVRMREGDAMQTPGAYSSHRGHRGGSWNQPAVLARSANREKSATSTRNSALGLRCARAVRP
ncbi:MAG: bifunctional serine/threonine-protein kinase/formylglycine-generating enzyme family protein [Planctomycetota bacterium]